MIRQTRELRGIPLWLLKVYLAEIGGVEQEQDIILGTGWKIKLEQLDDLVFDALSGHASALDALAQAWPRTRDELGADLLTESREQYLRHALSVWEGSADPSARDPAQATHARDVLSILFERM